MISNIPINEGDTVDVVSDMQLWSLQERRSPQMNEYHFLDENTELTKSDLIRKYNCLIEDIWLLQQTVRELDDNYELMLNAYEDVADKLYG